MEIQANFETDRTGLNTGQSIYEVNLLNSSVYNPSVSGAINSIDISFDAKFLGGSTRHESDGFMVAFEQGSTIFVPLTVGVAQGPGNSQGPPFQSFSFSGFSAADFVTIIFIQTTNADYPIAAAQEQPGVASAHLN